MAASFNKVMLIGNLTRDPELRHVASGQPVTTFSIAVNRTYTSGTGEKKDDVSYLRIVVWGRSAEACNEYLSKGSPVFVEGRLQSRSWEAQDGSKRNTVEVVANNVQFLGRSGGSNRNGNESQSSSFPSDNSNDVGIGEVSSSDINLEETDIVLDDNPPF